MTKTMWFSLVLLPAGFTATLCAQETNSASAYSSSAEEIAAELANPLAPITTMTAQFRAEFGNGPDHVVNYQTRLQPALFKPMGDKSAFLLRTIFPFYFKQWPTSNSGLGDITLVPYYVPDITKSVFVGYGSAFGVPSATEDSLGSKKWTAGPAMIIAKAGQPWTYGMLFQQVWSFAGDEDRGNISVLTAQPFVTRLLGDGWATTFNCESSYNWEAERDSWTVPLALSFSKVVNVSGLNFNVGVGGVYYAEKPDGAPDSEVRLNITYVFR